MGIERILLPLVRRIFDLEGTRAGIRVEDRLSWPGAQRGTEHLAPDFSIGPGAIASHDRALAAPGIRLFDARERAPQMATELLAHLLSAQA